MSAITTALEIAGMAAVVVGAGQLLPPLWWIVGGIAALVLAWRLS